ncbi:MAG: sensor histidine kinase, partial [Acidobacteriota bacterium]
AMENGGGTGACLLYNLRRPATLQAPSHVADLHRRATPGTPSGGAISNEVSEAAEARPPRRPIFLHPAIFISGFVLVGLLFALQEYLNAHRWGYRISLLFLSEMWGMQFLLWGVICWMLWRFLRSFIVSASPKALFTRALPLSMALSILEEMIWVLFFPKVPIDRPPMDYWHRLLFQLDAEFVFSIAIFWSAFVLFRGVSYYQKFREKEMVASRLQVQLVEARLAALRMQLNPHFLFNAMNSISSLMRTDIDAADTMLEQLSSLLRMTLEHGEVQLIPLHQEVEFIETYLAMQQQRYAGRVRQTVSVEPELHDAMVPALILQPIVENAFIHGLSKCAENGELAIEIRRDGKRVRMCVVNSGIGLGTQQSERRGVGLANVRDRLRLHYGERGLLAIKDLGMGRVSATIALPLQMNSNGTRKAVRSTHDDPGSVGG